MKRTKVKTSDSTPSKRRSGIQSVEIGLRVLESLASFGRSSPLSAIIKRCGLSPSQTHRYLASLIVAGMAQQDARGNYDLGPGALKLGLGALARRGIFQTADEAVAAFSESSGRTVLIAALGPFGPTVVRWHAGWPPVVTSLTVGSALPILRSATGQIFLAFVPERETRLIVQRELASGDGLVPVNIEALRDEVRAAGLATSEGLVIPGLRAHAFPVFDIQGRAIFAVTMVASEAFQRSHDAAAAAELQRVCSEISRKLGGQARLP